MSSFVKASGSITPNSADPGEEFPFLHTITVVDRVVSVDKPELVQNNINTETVTLNLDSEWEGLSTVINIGNDEPPTSLIWSGQPVVIPAELMTDVGALNLSASQSNQNTYLIDRLQPCPTPAYVVPNPNGYYGCQQNGYQSCGC